MARLGYRRVYRIALVSKDGDRDLLATAHALATEHEVTIVVGERAEPAASDRLRVVTVPEPSEEPVDYFNCAHLWSARVFERLKSVYPNAGPDLVEFEDVGGAAAVTVQARRTLDSVLARTVVVVRARVTQEMRDVLNGYLPVAARARAVYDLERYALKYADAFLSPGGDVVATYRRFYGDGVLAVPALCRPVVPAPEPAEAARRHRTMRFAYLSTLERRHGPLDLIRAFIGLERDDWSLTVASVDTRTGQYGVSVRQELELMAADDERIVFRDSPEPDELPQLAADHDVVVFPSLWECWPVEALTALAVNRPLLATPVGGLVELVEHGVSGWLTSGTGEDPLATCLEGVLDGDLLIDRDGPRGVFNRVANRDAALKAYAQLVGSRAKARRVKRSRPLVSAVVPYYRLHRYVRETVASLFEQTYGELEVIVVNDGSFRDADAVLETLACEYPIVVLTQQNSGLGAARNFGIRQARGRYVFPLDADNAAAAPFVERSVEVLEGDPALAYVTAWTRFVWERGATGAAFGFHPLSNDALNLGALNTAGDAAAVFRRSVFEKGFWYSVDTAGSYEDWLLYRRLARAGLYGHAIPEPLLLYRVRRDSMLRDLGVPHHERLLGEVEAALRAREVQWTATNV
jgi:glycosyltransferase involved in cell wall biosynthesis